MSRGSGGRASLPSFGKPFTTASDQVSILEQRGVTVADRAAAESFLAHINYYRFTGYCLAFEKTRHVFCDGVTFEAVRAAYEFDQMLRDLFAEALEVVEVDVRTAIANRFGSTYGAFGHTDPGNFHSSFKHQNWAGKLRHEAKRSNELFVEHFKASYSEFPDLPVWMATEIMSFGSLSIMFKHMQKPDQKVIAGRYGVQPLILASWLHHLVYLRNLCAHHSRIWDRRWIIKPKLPAGKAWAPPAPPSNDCVLATILILNQLLKSCPAIATFHVDWRERLMKLLDLPPQCDHPLKRMGMTTSWHAHSLWQ